MDSTYLVWFHSLQFPPRPGTESIVSKRVEAATFIEVEDWSHDNTPAGYEVREIAKHYGTPTELDMYGAVDVSLR